MAIFKHTQIERGISSRAHAMNKQTNTRFAVHLNEEKEGEKEEEEEEVRNQQNYNE